MSYPAPGNYQGPPVMAPPQYHGPSMPQPRYPGPPAPPPRGQTETGFLEGCLAGLCCCCLLDWCSDPEPTNVTNNYYTEQQFY